MHGGGRGSSPADVQHGHAEMASRPPRAGGDSTPAFGRRASQSGSSGGAAPWGTSPDVGSVPGPGYGYGAPGQVDRGQPQPQPGLGLSGSGFGQQQQQQHEHRAMGKRGASPGGLSSGHGGASASTAGRGLTADMDASDAMTLIRNRNRGGSSIFG